MTDAQSVSHITQKVLMFFRKSIYISYFIIDLLFYQYYLSTVINGAYKILRNMQHYIIYLLIVDFKAFFFTNVHYFCHKFSCFTLFLIKK